MTNKHTTDDDKARARRIDRYAASEKNIFERLLGMRSELDAMLRLIDRSVMNGMSSRHRTLPRGIVDLLERGRR